MESRKHWVSRERRVFMSLDYIWRVVTAGFRNLEYIRRVETAGFRNLEHIRGVEQTLGIFLLSFLF